MKDAIYLFNLKTICNLFIETIESIKPKLSITMKTFPYASCDDASYLLGRLLDEKGLGEYDLIRTQRGSQSHSWLVLNDIIIDITIHQFNNLFQTYYVGPITEFHKSFEVIRCLPYTEAIHKNDSNYIPLMEDYYWLTH